MEMLRINKNVFSNLLKEWMERVNEMGKWKNNQLIDQYIPVQFKNTSIDLSNCVSVSVFFLPPLQTILNMMTVTETAWTGETRTPHIPFTQAHTYSY